MKLTKEQRDRLDCDVIRALKPWTGSRPTYVIRNMLDWPGEPWHRKGLKTPDILRACRRNEKRGLMAESHTSYDVMKSWQLTSAGRAAAALPAPETMAEVSGDG